MFLSNFIAKSTLVYLNDGSATRISANKNHVSAPDLTITLSEMAEVCSWEVLDDPVGSDHLPVFIGLREKFIDNGGDKVERPKLLLTCFDSELFNKHLIESFAVENFKSSNGAELYEDWYNRYNWYNILCCLKAGARKRDPSGNFLSFNHQKDQIVNSMKKSVGKRERRLNKPWWDDKCEEAIKERKKAYTRVLNNPNRENLLNYRVVSHETRKCLKKRKRANFKSFVSDIASMSMSQFWENINKMKNCAFNNRKSFPSASKLEAARSTIEKLSPPGCFNSLEFSESD